MNGAGGQPSTSSCQATCGGGDTQAVQLCSTDAECKGGKCQATQLGLKLCRKSGGGGSGGAGGGGIPNIDAGAH